MRSAQLEPDTGGLKYFYLGQLLSGRESLMAYRKCIEVMIKEGAGRGGDDEVPERLISIYCLIGELFMTDLADDDEAESECQKAFQSALDIDSSSVEALNGIATFHRMRLEIDESKNFCSRAVEIVDSIPSEELEDSIPFPIRMRLAENLVELEMIDDALAVLGSLLSEDEEDLQSWFLTGCCHLIAKEKQEALECVSQSRRLLKKNRSAIDPIVFQHWIKTFSELDDRIKKL
jgi:tetratricopeptide (TPR) repeat protein